MTTSLWRNRHDPAKTDDSLNAVQFAVKKGIVGVNWAVEAETGTSISKKQYERLSQTAGYPDKDAWVRSIRAIQDNMKKNDLCYTRDQSGQFYLGRVTGSWRYENDPEFNKHGMVNVRDCDWYRIQSPEETVPTELLESFESGAVLQRIKNERLLAFSQRLFELMDDTERYEIDLPYTLDNWLSDDDLKDLLAIHLQANRDQLLIPSSVDQPPFLPDGMTVNRISSDRTLYQVQHQHDKLPSGAYQQGNRNLVYLRRQNNERPDLPNKVEVLKLEDLESVFEDHWDLLPRRLRIIGDVLKENGPLKTTTSTRVPGKNSKGPKKKTSRKAAGLTTRSFLYLIAGFLLGLALMGSYNRWTGSTDRPPGQQNRITALQQKVDALQTSQAERTTQRDQLMAQQGTNETRARSNWVNVRIRQDDTLSELLERFQGNQNQQNDVVARNNLTNRDLIQTGSTLSFPSQNTQRMDTIASK